MKVLAVTNQKGGVGKSTTAHAIGAGLIQQGNRVLYIDADAQGNLTYTMGVKADGYGTMGILERPETITQEIQHTAQGDIVPSVQALSLAGLRLTETGKEYRLKESLEQVSSLYDYVIIDTPPELSVIITNALTACNGVIIPAQADIFSLQGIGQLNSTIESVKKYCNPDLKVLGVVVTRYNSRSTLNKDMADNLNKISEMIHTKVYDTKIRECTALKERQAMKQDIYSYAPKSNARQDYNNLLAEILKDL